MRKTTRAIAEEMGFMPISIWTAIKMLFHGVRPNIYWGFKTSKKGVRAWRTGGPR